MSNPESLIDDVIKYLEEQRKLFGGLGIQEFDDTEVDISPESTSNTNKTDSPPSATDQKEAPKKQQVQSASDTTDKAAAKKQKNVFEEGGSTNVYDQVEAASSLEQLREVCTGAEELHTDLEGTNLVFGVGNPNADLLLIGEAPGFQEDKQGEPFVGKAGQLLNKILKAINFERKDVYIANILKHRPPNNRNPLPEERERSLPFLMKQIDLIQPKLILCLGKVSANTLLDNSNSLGSMRGTFHRFRDIYELMVTYHPAALLRNPQWKRPTWEDVQLLRKRYDELGCTP